MKTLICGFMIALAALLVSGCKDSCPEGKCTACVCEKCCHKAPCCDKCTCGKCDKDGCKAKCGCNCANCCAKVACCENCCCVACTGK